MAASFKMTGEKEVLANLQKLAKRSVRNRIARKAVKTCGTIVYKAARKRMTHDDRTKALKKSYGHKEKVYNDTAVSLVGARAGFKTTWTSPSGKTYPVDPLYYDHLVEKGHGGPHPAKPYSHLMPAWEATQEQCKEVLAKEIMEGLEKALEKAALR